MSTPQEQPPPVVPTTATQDGEVREHWLWAEPTVWTERMLTALEQGVRGNVWFRLMDKVFAERNLHTTAAKVSANRGEACDH